AQPPSFTLNFPYPALGGVSILESRGSSTDEALQARFEHRLAKGFTVLASYSFQKTLTDLDSSGAGVANGAGPFGPQTIKNLRANKGPSVFDRPHSLTVSTLYALPVFRNRNDLLGKLAGGWQVGTIANFQSGAYLTPS